MNRSFDSISVEGRESRIHHWQAIALLAALAAIAYLPAYAPILHGDDWATMAWLNFAEAGGWIQWTGIRPLVGIPFWILHSLFGMNIHVFYAALWISVVVRSIQIYFITSRLAPSKLGLALILAALVLIYPADHTRMWLIMLNGVSVNLFLLYAWLLLKYADTGNLPTLGASLLCLCLSYTISEIQIGLALAWSLFLVVLERKASRRRRVSALVLVTLLSGMLGLHRWLISGYEGKTGSYTTDMISLSPILALERILTGLKMLVASWTATWSSSAGIPRNLHLLLGLGLASLLCGLGAAYLSRKHVDCERGHITRETKKIELKKLLLIVCVGIAFTVAGYVPIVFVYAPEWAGVGTRIHRLTTPGAALVMTSLLAVMALFVARHRRQVEMIMLASAVPLLIAGISTQLLVQRQADLTWNEQKQIWQQLFTLAPDLKDHTAVFFVFTGSEPFNSAKRAPFQHVWEVTDAIQILYDNETLKGSLLYPNTDRKCEITLDEQGIVDSCLEHKPIRIPYERAIFFLYHEDSKQLELVEDLQDELHLGWATPGYAAHDRVLPTQTHAVELRRLVVSPATKLANTGD